MPLVRTLVRTWGGVQAVFTPGVLVGVCLLYGVTAHAQLPQTRLHSIFPAGGQAGTTVELTLTGGADLEEVEALTFSHPGITATPKLREENGQQVPVGNIFVVSIAADVPIGVYDVVCRGLYGTSNPRSFAIGRLPEVQESEANNSVDTANPVELNKVINGRSNGGADVDWFRFEGKAGQRVLCVCQAMGIDSRLQPVLELYDTSGRRIARAGRQSQHEPLLDAVLPADGAYILKLYDFVYGGGNDYFYRLTVHTGPYIEYALPPAGVAGTTSTVTLYGRNLPNGVDAGTDAEGNLLQKLEVPIAFPSESQVRQSRVNLSSHQSDVDGFTYTLETPAGQSNPIFLAFSEHAPVLEQEPNDTAEKSQALTVPNAVAGQFQSVGDIDHWTFEAKANDVLIIDVLAQRLGAPVDAFLVVEQVTKKEDGTETAKRLTAVDDDGTNLAPFHFDTNTYDPVFRFVAPADGTYRISLRDRYTDSRGGPHLFYLLKIRREQPDFKLITVPVAPLDGQNNNTASTWSLGLRKGDQLGVQVLAVRRDGFKEAIELTAEGLPEGVSCPGACLGPDQTSTTMIFTASPDAKEWHGTVRVVGRVQRDNTAEKQAAETAQAAAKQAQEQLESARAQAEQAAQQVQAAEAAVATAMETLAAARQQAEERQAALAAAQKADTEARQAAEVAVTAFKKSQEVATRGALNGTIVWNGNQNVRAISRLSRDLRLSVMNEVAPYQLSHEITEVTAHQSRQILVPIKLDKRNGFDDQVALTFVGQPKNVDVENKPIEKGQTEGVFRLFVKENAPPGDYTVYARSKATVPYRRNVAALDRAKAKQAETEQSLKAAQEAENTANAARDEAVKQAAAAAEALKQREAVQQASAKSAAEAAQAAKKAAAELQQAQAEATKASEAAKAADEALKSAQAALALQPDDQKLKEGTAAAEKAATDAAAAAKTATDRVTQLAKTATESQATAEKAAAALKAADEMLVAARKQAEVAEAAKSTAEGQAKAATEKKKAAEATKAAVDKEVAAAEKAAAAKNLTVYAPSTPIVLHIKPAPVTVSANVPNGGAVKAGDKLELKVTIKRQNGFEGPVKLTLPLPPGVSGLTAESVTIPPDQTEATLSVQAAADAAEGQPAHLVVRAETEFAGASATVDQPVTLKITK